ncbi:hypothetical protein EW146_g1688 [Bondarzewia mesenterica]|uniref:MutL C-terminal dimerisation domain-containing protein n=1 Tax=Bondarzewia mesenterica TaxID=1095465 RepID=A0A4S4M4W7_9AGAM|nr:hypothetical protein EW146_g1688 [Bondarzewia mesenterica]
MERLSEPVVTELVQNSLDAGAGHIEIGLDCEIWECWVKDNGGGISRDSMSLLSKGLEAGRYNTSKVYVPDTSGSISTFGFRALASAADISCLEISSRTTRSRDSWSVILKSGQCLYDGPSVRWRRETPGTVVCLRDVFYNVGDPFVSSKYQYIFSLYSASYPSTVASTPLENYRVNIHKKREGQVEKGRVTSIPKTPSTLAAFRHIHGKALAAHVDEIDLIRGEMSIRGFISLNGAHSKSHQYLSLLQSTHSTKQVNPACLDLVRINLFMDLVCISSVYDIATRRSPRKSELKPVYALDIAISRRDVDNCLEPDKATVQFLNNEAVCTFLGSVIYSFLARHGFVVHSQPAVMDSPRKKRKLYDAVSPSKKRYASLPVIPTIPRDVHTQPDVNSRPGSAPIMINTDNASDEVVLDRPEFWHHSTVEETDSKEPESGSEFKRLLVDTRRLKKIQEQESGIIDKKTPQWILNALKANTSFTPAEPRIPAISLDLPSNSCRSDPATDCVPSHSSAHLSRFFSHSSERYLIGRFRRSDLLRAKVISQLDKKFIVCAIDAPSDDSAVTSAGNPHEVDRALVLIDQHAASERVRVERFLKDLCVGFLDAEGTSALRVELVPHQPVLLTRAEAQVLRGSGEAKAVLERWGFTFSGDTEYESQDAIYEQVLVSSVPEVISEKLFISSELQELLKEFLATYEMVGIPSLANTRSTGHDHTSSEPPDVVYWWQKARQHRHSKGFPERAPSTVRDHLRPFATVSTVAPAHVTCLFRIPPQGAPSTRANPSVGVRVLGLRSLAKSLPALTARGEGSETERWHCR